MAEQISFQTTCQQQHPLDLVQQALLTQILRESMALHRPQLKRVHQELLQLKRMASALNRKFHTLATTNYHQLNQKKLLNQELVQTSATVTNKHALCQELKQTFAAVWAKEERNRQFCDLAMQAKQEIAKITVGAANKETLFTKRAPHFIKMLIKQEATTRKAAVAPSSSGRAANWAAGSSGVSL